MVARIVQATNSHRKLATTSRTFRKKIGLATVNAITPETTIWDTDIKGFCIRRQKTDAVSYLLKLRIRGRIRWLTIGRHGQPWTPDAARCTRNVAARAAQEALIEERYGQGDRLLAEAMARVHALPRRRPRLARRRTRPHRRPPGKQGYRPATLGPEDTARQRSGRLSARPCGLRRVLTR